MRQRSRHRRSLVRRLVVLLLFCGGTVTHAADDTPTRAWAFTFENDLFFQNDQYYTNGVQLAWWSRESTPARLTTKLIGALCHENTCNPGTYEYGRYKFGQLMYTPENITKARNQPYDRPWAGMLYLSKDWVYDAKKRGRHSFTALVGVIGPYSYAEQTQKWIHETFTGKPPNGWDNQIGRELAILLGYKGEHAIPGLSLGGEDEFQVRTARSLRVGVGNVMTFVGLGLTTAFGKNLRDIPSLGGIETKQLRPTPAEREVASASGRRAQHPRMACPFAWVECSFLAAIEGRIVAHNIFLDGNTFSDDNDIRIEKRPFVVDASAGVRFDFPGTRGFLGGGPLFLSFITTWRSPEFTSARGSVGSQRFAALSVGQDL